MFECDPVLLYQAEKLDHNLILELNLVMCLVVQIDCQASDLGLLAARRNKIPEAVHRAMKNAFSARVLMASRLQGMITKATMVTIV